MEDHSQEEELRLRLYIVYEDHLYAEQFSNILSSLESLYNSLYIALTPELSLPLPLETRMRIDECRTGQSIELLLSEGIRQVVEASGPFIQVLGPTGVIGVMVGLIFGYAKSFAEFRKTWYEGLQGKHAANKTKYESDKARFEAEKARYEVERLKREIESEEIAKKLSQSNSDISTIPTESKQQATKAINDFFNVLEDAPNIIRVRVNDIVILDNRPDLQSH